MAHSVRIAQLLDFFLQNTVIGYKPTDLTVWLSPANPPPTPILLPRLRAIDWGRDQMYGGRRTGSGGSGMNFHLEGVEVEEDASTWEYGDGGIRKKRETGYRVYLCRLILPSSPSPCCATQSPHEDVVIIKCILYIVVLKWQDGFCVVQLWRTNFPK